MFFTAPHEKSIEQIIDDLTNHPFLTEYIGGINYDEEGLHKLRDIKDFLTNNDDLIDLRHTFPVDNQNSEIRKPLPNSNDLVVFPFNRNPATVQQNRMYNRGNRLDISNTIFDITYFRSLNQFNLLSRDYQNKVINLNFNLKFNVTSMYIGIQNNIKIYAKIALNRVGNRVFDDLIDAIQTGGPLPKKITKKVYKKYKFYIEALTILYS